jgi:hypothetical protein
MSLPSGIEDRHAKRLLLLGLIVSCLFGLKLSFLPGTGPYGLDGSFYVNVARNVQEGVGLKTNVSMYHGGETTLPTASRLIYPLWPLLLGYSARLIGLVSAVNYLPPLLYGADLLLLYLLMSRLAVRLRCPTDALFTPGHLLVLLLGLNFTFYGSTTFPYTEGLGFFFALVAALLIDHAVSVRSALWGGLAGLAAGLALLTRTQMVIVGLALLIVVLWVAASNRRFIGLAAAYGIVFCSILAFMNTVVLHMEESPRVPLPRFRMWLEPPTRMGWWMERLQGIVVSFSPFDSNSFFHSFQTAFLIPIIAAVVALVRWIRLLRGPGAEEGAQRVGSGVRLRAEAALPAAFVLVALGTYCSLILFHGDPEFIMPWLFGYRHGVPMIFGVAVATAYLWGLGRTARSITLICALVAILVGLTSIIGFVTGPPSPSPTPAEKALSVWLDRQPSRPVILTARSQHLSVYTHAGIHWTECRTSAKTTRIMMEKLPIDYVIVYAAERPCEFFKGMGDVLVERIAFGKDPDRIDVLGRRQPVSHP